MADVDAWLADLGTALGVSAEEVLPQALRDEMLGLTGEVAHRVVRLAVPLTSYLAGVAVGRGASPQDVLAIVSGLLPPAPASDA